MSIKSSLLVAQLFTQDRDIMDAAILLME